MVRNGVQQPFYDLAEVRRLAIERKARFLPRDDGKSDPEKLGVDEDYALDIIASLSVTDFDITLEGDERRPPADVYKTRRKLQEGDVPVTIYIKLAIRRNGQLLLVISFHK